ncbi:hypothetical protein V9T40_000225 [Parthenolecanium corni]|uniref:Uncharacterized protein n=1 Tax=Parthenolecanium corni TaxID=536013 RepID=A0AAN9Y051_9HEMI
MLARLPSAIFTLPDEAPAPLHPCSASPNSDIAATITTRFCQTFQIPGQLSSKSPLALLPPSQQINADGLNQMDEKAFTRRVASHSVRIISSFRIRLAGFLAEIKATEKRIVSSALNIFGFGGASALQSTDTLAVKLANNLPDASRRDATPCSKYVEYKAAGAILCLWGRLPMDSTRLDSYTSLNFRLDVSCFVQLSHFSSRCPNFLPDVTDFVYTRMSHFSASCLNFRLVFSIFGWNCDVWKKSGTYRRKLIDLDEH